MNIVFLKVYLLMSIPGRKKDTLRFCIRRLSFKPYFYILEADPLNLSLHQVIPSENNGASELVPVWRTGPYVMWFTFQKLKYVWNEGLSFLMYSKKRDFKNSFMSRKNFLGCQLAFMICLYRVFQNQSSFCSLCQRCNY